MKDQYVGDVNDYLKYAVLRAWRDEGLSTTLAWMRTAADQRNDGVMTRYLSQPERFRALDPQLFDELADIVNAGRRSVAAVIEAKLLGDYSLETLLDDGRHARDGWFARLADMASATQVLFLDPDNGLEVASVARGAPGSRRYVFLSELQRLHGPDRAVCVYQHFPRVQRRSFVEQQLRRLGGAWPGALTYAVCSSRIALLVSAPSSLAETMLRTSRHLVRSDPGGVAAWIHVA